MKLFKAGLLLGVGLLVIGLSVAFLCAFATPSYASYQALKLNGSGYASIADGSQAGLSMGLSDFMIEARIRTTYGGASQRIASKREGTVGYEFYIASDGIITFFIGDSGGYLVVSNGVFINNDGKWHYVVVAADRSGNVTLYVDGLFDGITGISARSESLDGSNPFALGTSSTTLGNVPFIGFLDEVRVWNFGKDGLPADFNNYITWRATGRNVFLDISEYNSGSWNCYADADRTEVLDDPGLEAWTGDLLDDWTETGLSGGVRDLFDENGTGDHIFHGGSHAAKFQATNAGGTAFQVTQGITLVANNYYEVLGWMYYPTRTAGSIDMLLWNATDGVYAQVALTGTNADYVEYSVVGKPTVTGNIIYARMQDETDTGIAYFDDISVKRTGLVGHWKFENGYLDEGSNDNDLTAGGSGNTFPGYTLKRQKIISPASVN